MSKYNRQLKLTIAKQLSNSSSGKLALQYNVCARSIRYWGAVYSIHGDDSFQHIGSPYSREFKINTIDVMNTKDWTLGYTSAFYDLSSQGILSNWRQKFNDGSISQINSRCGDCNSMRKSPTSSYLKETINMTEAQLREELEYLRAENALLKKLEALAQGKKLQTKKRP
jgi:transposase